LYEEDEDDRTKEAQEQNLITLERSLSQHDIGTFTKLNVSRQQYIDYLYVRY